MAVPKKRTASAKRNMRRSHHSMKKLQLSPCPRCARLLPSHTACPECGTYKGREVIDVMKKLDKQERKQKEKEQAEAQAKQSEQGE